MDNSKTVTVIGSGLVGKCWAIIFARGGYTVHLYDVLPNFQEGALAYIKETSQELEKIGLLKKSKSAEEVVARVKCITSLDEALKGSLWVQECVPENLQSKKELFAQLDNWLTAQETQTNAKIDIILASSTSAIPASAFTENLNHRDKCLVAHPVNPPHLIPVVEIVPAKWTDPVVAKKAYEIMEEVGQAPVMVKKEVDSFVINRLQGALLNEAFRLVEDGVVSPEDLDKTVRDGLGLRWSFMGPFETIDLNAPGGVADYIQRYSGNMYSLAQQQAVARKWEGEVVNSVVKERRSIIDVEKLGERSMWRNKRLMALMAHKAEQEDKDKQPK